MLDTRRPRRRLMLAAIAFVALALAPRYIGSDRATRIALAAMFLQAIIAAFEWISAFTTMRDLDRAARLLSERAQRGELPKVERCVACGGIRPLRAVDRAE